MKRDPQKRPISMKRDPQKRLISMNMGSYISHLLFICRVYVVISASHMKRRRDKYTDRALILESCYGCLFIDIGFFCWFLFRGYRSLVSLWIENKICLLTLFIEISLVLISFYTSRSLLSISSHAVSRDG